jgi:Xaa-Pro aminopeptidase
VNDTERTHARLAAARSWMRERELDQLYVYSYRSALTAYWTGYCPRHSVTNASLLALTERDAVHVTRLPVHVATAERSRSPIEHLCAAPTGWAVATVEDLVETAVSRLGADGGGRAALAAYGPEAGVRGSLEQRVGTTENVTAELVDAFHGTKDAEDLKSLRKAAAAAQEAFDVGVAALRPGGAPADAVRAAEAVLRDHGSVTWHCFAGGTDRLGRSLLQSSAAVLEPGTTAFFEVIPDIDSFCPEIVSTVFVGEPSPDAAEIHELIYRTLETALGAINARMSFGELFELMISPILATGAAETDVTRLGHSTGLDNIELPEFLAPDDTRPFREGRVLSIHPNVRHGTYGTLFRGGTVVVGEAGCEPLFSFPDEPLVVS